MGRIAPVAPMLSGAAGWCRMSSITTQPIPVRDSYNVALAETAAVTVLRHIADDLRVWEHGDEARRTKPADPGAFLPNPHSSLCSAKWCPAHGSEFCTAHLRED